MCRQNRHAVTERTIGCNWEHVTSEEGMQNTEANLASAQRACVRTHGTQSLITAFLQSRALEAACLTNPACRKAPLAPSIVDFSPAEVLSI